MQIFYHTINSLVTFFYYFCQIFLLSNIVDHKKHIIKTIFIYTSVFLVETIMTQTSVPLIIKSSVQEILYIIMYRLLLSEKVATVAVHIIYLDLFTLLQENLIIIFCKLNHIVPWVDVGHGVQLGKARVILISSLFQFILTLLLKQILKPSSVIMEKGNTWFLVFVGFVLLCLDEVIKQFFYQYIEGAYLFIGIVLLVGIILVGMILYLFFVRFFYLEKVEREERAQREILEKQFVYYQEKQKDEERVRSIYHDMKNHLLVLEHQIHSSETAKMVEKLQREVENYADYVHTGNDFLDVILKDKAGIAREKQIDFSATVDMQGVDFIEPLDISTIFGNGLDNAIEASEQLPKGQRVIQVKTCRVQNFLSIMMENNCQEENDQKKKHSSKKDEYFHGFGISNMKKAAEQYGGQLTVKCEDGKFTLNILIPIP
ncbi:MAG: GHKL domain-containing protein [Lachnospiraceae bacterium]|nr:GHKL domain-containing protein [Lachnospiraceae bacterium]